MKMYFMSMCMGMLTMVTASGCGDSTKDGNTAADPTTARTPSGAETSVADKPVADKPVAGEADQTFALSVPFEPIALTQGGEAPVRIGINRGENFEEQVNIEISGLPNGVTVDTKDPAITPGSMGVDLLLKATADASLGDFTAKVTGKTASSGADFSEEIQFTVSQQ